MKDPFVQKLAVTGLALVALVLTRVVPDQTVALVGLSGLLLGWAWAKRPGDEKADKPDPDKPANDLESEP